MKLGIVLLTYSSAPESPRSQYADLTLRALIRKLKTKHEVHLHIADDGSYDGHVKHLSRLAEEAGWTITTSDANRGGYGRSYNLATQKMHSFCDYFLMMEDDWELTKEFYVDPLVEALQNGNDDLGCIRLGYIGATNDLIGKIAWFSDQTFLLFGPDSTETHVWTGHPRLESIGFQRKVGEWPEGLRAGETEMVISNRKESRVGVAWPLDIAIRAGQIHGTLFAHIGEVQAGAE